MRNKSCSRTGKEGKTKEVRYRITFPSETKIPSQPLTKKTIRIHWKVSRNCKSTSISSSLKHLTQKRISKRILCILRWITLRRRFQKKIVSTSDTRSIETTSSWFSRKYSSSRGKTILLLSGQPLKKPQPFPHLIFPLLKLSTPNCPWVKKCKETNNVLKEDLKQMTMDCPRPLLRLNTTPMCPSVPLVSPQDTMQTPRQRRPRALPRHRWCRSSTHAPSSNDTHQLDWAIEPNWTSEM